MSGLTYTYSSLDIINIT